MLKYPLNDFIASVPSCLETTTLAIVLEIFQEKQCDRLIILNQQQCPTGLLYSASLVLQLLLSEQKDQNPNFLDLQQPVASLDKALIQQVQTLPDSSCVEQLGSFLRSQQTQTYTNLDLALIDKAGKFVGLVDSSRLLQCVAKQRLSMSSKTDGYSAFTKANLRTSTNTEERKNPAGKQQRIEYKPLQEKPLVHLLERLPWPLMLQTSTGEVVTQNPAWWQQFGTFKDPEGVRQQVQAILSTDPAKSQHPNQKAVVNSRDRSNEHNSQKQPNPLKLHSQENTVSVLTEAIPEKTLPRRSKSASAKKHQEQQPLEIAGSRCFLDNQLGTCTCVVEVQNGQERIWQFVKIPLDSPHSELSPSTDLWLMLATDVTEQQQLCKELAAKNADLIQLNRLKDEFLACISHELKTPLTAVLGLSRLLVDQQLGELNERQARYAGLIHQSGRHLMSVVNDILDLTRMETGQMELTLSHVKIRAVCDRAISEAKTIHRETSKATHLRQTQASPLPEHQLTISIEPGLDEMVADELRLRQMLVHLLSNAFKFTETGGEIGLWVNRWEGWITFTVWDTGIGIPEHQQHLIFQKFQQLENPLTRQHEGTGLGLVLTRALARLHGGDVSFLSREGKGSQFTLLLPPSPPQRRAGDMGTWGQQDLESKSGSYSWFPHSNPTGIATTPKLHNRTANGQTGHHSDATSHNNEHTHDNSLVLVVEAVAQYIEDLTLSLTRLGYRVVIARSGCEALEKARRLQPKAIFLNPLLPLLSGWDVLTLLKSDAVTRHISVVVTATRAEKKQAIANQAEGFLSLPVEHQVLAPLLEKLCTTPEIRQQKLHSGETISTKTPLRILRLVDPEWEFIHPHLSLQNHRVVEVDDLDQAELLARVWRFDVVLLDAEIPAAGTYLQKLSQYKRLVALPLVTCDVATTQAATQVAGISVFPCLSKPLGIDQRIGRRKTDSLLSVLQIAAGVSCPPNILVVDFAMLPDLPEVRHKQTKGDSSQKNSSQSSVSDQINTSSPSFGLKPLTISRGSEWFQALIQYLQTAGLKAVMGRSWAELLQQIRHQSVDLLLICLGESTIQKEVYLALKTLGQLPFDLPPILVLDQRLNPNEVEDKQPQTPQKGTQKKNNTVESLETVVGTIANEILPRSISMEDLLNKINQALNVSC
ncbi:MAG: hybrid sensor histidine kinase/response regulator [Stigonema ocellatum SAG 48.90 = DSM 106950]|nr:hybrid sensor histidine kinase/response regulator [Stigonema ocellatum SAG 48.90 = DSM 106950]